jgi:hypothetical protein
MKDWNEIPPDIKNVPGQKKLSVLTADGRRPGRPSQRHSEVHIQKRREPGQQIINSDVLQADQEGHDELHLKYQVSIPEQFSRCMLDKKNSPANI